MPRFRKDADGLGAPKRVTIRDIATVAGVHAMTVSDALNGTRRVAPATRERIIQIAREMNYVPNLTARALATGRTGRIGFLSGSLNSSYYAHMLQFLKLELDEANYKLLVFRTPREVRGLIQASKNTEVDGVIAVDMYSFSEEFGEQISIPCVSIGAHKREAVDYVLVDLSAGVEAAIDLMIKAGCQRIAYFVSSQYMASPEESRARGYFAAMQRIGKNPEIINVQADHQSAVQHRLATYLREHGCPDGLLCQNDELAMFALRVLRDAGRQVPNDVLLVGCDGQLPMECFVPSLSTILQPLEETCSTAWRFLRQRIANPASPHQKAVLQGELIVRESLLAPHYAEQQREK